MTKKEIETQLQREREWSKHLWEELKTMQKRFYAPLSKDKLCKEQAVDFGKFLISMNVGSVNYPKTFKTNCGMAPDIIIESMESMYDRHMEAKVPY